MKRLFLIISLVIIAAAVIGSVDFIVQRSLDRYLPPLLTRELGLPVTLAPIRADTLTLTAYTDRLQMGPDGDPAVVATGVSVSLDWTDLLAGEIRLVEATGEDLMLKVSSWPSSDDPLPTDYHFLDPWLPASIDLAHMRYVFEDDSSWVTERGRWRRSEDGKASLAWHEQRPAGSFDLEVVADALDDLLGLQKLDGTVALSAAGENVPDSKLTLHIAPAPDKGYKLNLSGLLAGMAVEATASGSDDWTWPTQSVTQVKTFYPGRMAELVKLFTADGTEGDLEQALQGALPTLSLPYHQGIVKIDEIRIDDEMVHDNTIEFLADGPRLAVTDIILNGPSGRLRGAAAAVSIVEGWEVAVGTDVAARESDAGLLNRYIDADWYFDRGKLRLKSRGKTWGSLLDGMTGLMEVSGWHRGAVQTPVSVNARLGGSPQEFALENISLQLGKSAVAGAVHFSGGAERKLHIKADATDLDLRFLFEGETASTKPGIALPEYLLLFPGIDLTWDVNVHGVTLPAFELASAALDFSRNEAGGHLTMTGVGKRDGKVDLRLDYEVPATGPVPVTLEIDLDRIDMARTLGQQDGMATRSSGVLSFSSSGTNAPEVFSALKGQADLTVEFRDDNDWQRDAGPEERVNLQGSSRLLIERNRIVGLEIDDIALNSVGQDLRGRVSVSVAREPFLIATLDSDHLNLAQVLDWLPDSPDSGETGKPLQLLREIDQSRLDISIGELLWFEEPISNIEIRLESSLEQFDVSRLDFSYPGAKVSSKLTLTWKDDSADLAASGEVSSTGLEPFLQRQQTEAAAILEEKLEGDFNLSGSGSTFQDILANLSGRVKLSGHPRHADDPRPVTRLDVAMKRVDSGMSANVNALVLAGSDLRGSVFFAEHPRRQLQIELDGGVLDLEPWEKQLQETREKEEEKGIAGARVSATQFIGDILTAPARLFGDSVNDTAPSDRIFSEEPLDLEDFQAWDISVKGKLDRVNSKLSELRGLDLDVQLDYGVLTVKADAAYADQGSGWARMNFDSRASPPTLQGEILVRDTRGKREKSAFPRSAHTVFDSRGSSQAELAGNLNGIVYLEAGRGPLDYGRLSFLTADAATTMFRSLIPSAKDRQPELQCAITLMQFTDGKGITPYGYAARTRTANLLGGIEIDLKKEELTVRFRSRSREGVGLSVGNAFSNTVDIAGPLNKPKIVPNAPGLLVRGWAAFVTAGLSVVGESVLNRALASNNPCDDIRNQMRKDLCSSTLPLHDSPLACPADAAATEDGTSAADTRDSPVDTPPAIGPEGQ